MKGLHNACKGHWPAQGTRRRGLVKTKRNSVLEKLRATSHLFKGKYFFLRLVGRPCDRVSRQVSFVDRPIRDGLSLPKRPRQHSSAPETVEWRCAAHRGPVVHPEPRVWGCGSSVFLVTGKGRRACGTGAGKGRTPFATRSAWNALLSRLVVACLLVVVGRTGDKGRSCR